nr:hypothetical protein [bacterium]
VFNYPTLAEVYKIAALNGLNEVQKRTGHLEPLDVFGHPVSATGAPETEEEDVENPAEDDPEGNERNDAVKLEEVPIGASDKTRKSA